MLVGGIQLKVMDPASLLNTSKLVGGWGRTPKIFKRKLKNGKNERKCEIQKIIKQDSRTNATLHTVSDVVQVVHTRDV